MTHTIDDVKKCRITTRDGEVVGTIADIYFDDVDWTVRYLVVDTGHWLPGRQVLISPMAVERLEPASARAVVGLTREAIENGPGLETAEPVSRAWERTFSGYYGYPYYWAGPYIWGMAATPIAARTAALELAAGGPVPDEREMHLRSANEVSGYHIEAEDGSIGHVDDFVVDDGSWSIRDLVVDTSNWIGGRSVVLSRDDVRRIEWSERRVYVGVTRETVKASPGLRRGGEAGRAGGGAR
jgi:sporulation protein YlmC with PRC-barrel domain